MNRIELKNASFRYPNGFLANENLNLSIERGESVAIVGLNGAGKTTAVKMMNGLNKPTEGDVLVDGVNTKERTTAQIAKTVGYVFQNPDDQIFNQTVRAEIEYMPRYRKMDESEIKRRVDEAVDLTGIGQYIDQNPFDIPYSTRKFVTIAAILATQPKYMILDEPTAGQDLRGLETLRRLIAHMQEIGVGVITITHDMDFVAENFHRVVAMANKHIVMDDKMENVFSRQDILDQCQIKKPQIAQLSDRLGYPPGIIFRSQLREMIRQG